MLTNIEKSMISFQHEPEIKKIFNNYIKGELYIDHFSINVFFSNKSSIFLSPTPKMAENLCKYDFVDFDSNYKKDIYSNKTIYAWREVQQNNMDEAINHIKEEKFRLRNGMMIVRKLGNDRYVMYSFATTRGRCFDERLYMVYLAKANYIAEMGDFMYNELNETINLYTTKENIMMPKINKNLDIDLESRFVNNLQKDLYHKIRNLANSKLNLEKINHLERFSY